MPRRNRKDKRLRMLAAARKPVDVPDSKPEDLPSADKSDTESAGGEEEGKGPDVDHEDTFSTEGALVSHSGVFHSKEEVAIIKEGLQQWCSDEQIEIYGVKFLMDIAAKMSTGSTGESVKVAMTWLYKKVITDSPDNGRPTLERIAAVCSMIAEKPLSYVLNGVTKSGKGSGDVLPDAYAAFCPMQSEDDLNQMDPGDLLAMQQARSSYSDTWKLINLSRTRMVAMICYQALRTHVSRQWRLSWAVDGPMDVEESHPKIQSRSNAKIRSGRVMMDSPREISMKRINAFKSAWKIAVRDEKFRVYVSALKNLV